MDDNHIDFLREYLEIMAAPTEQINITFNLLETEESMPHVWDRFSFREFLDRSFVLSGVRSLTQVEYFLFVKNNRRSKRILLSDASRSRSSLA